MTNNIPDFYKNAIYHTFRDVLDIRYPTYPGQQNNLLFVKTTGGEYVAKFNVLDMVLKNCTVSRVMKQAGIPVPEIKIGKYQNTLFEYYPMIYGKTLFERILDGMPPAVIRRAFDDILTQFIKMDDLNCRALNVSKCTKAHETFSVHIKNTSSSVAALIYRSIVYLINHYSTQDVKLYHYDITPKNVIIDENGKLISFLDLDGVAMCTHDFAFRSISRSWAKQGLNTLELYDRYELLSNKPVNRRRLEKMCRYKYPTLFRLWRYLQKVK